MPSLMFANEVRSLPQRVAHEALPENIRLDWKGLPGTNTLDYLTVNMQ
jgi:hypothetical protein